MELTVLLALVRLAVLKGQCDALDLRQPVSFSLLAADRGPLSPEYRCSRLARYKGDIRPSSSRYFSSQTYPAGYLSIKYRSCIHILL
ncbi:hypothetical protein BDV96DRAFT_567082 [Lophiotrema nucula]|uniref:Secreted protein n=1 Tax=Lophiotrema nucula TaxID=690887 RepID=A0A6A5ZLS4_9PLEO|nr:hypothetical protein BDV96DRAFT_567082 [Lophiotrema nucula]